MSPEFVVYLSIKSSNELGYNWFHHTRPDFCRVPEFVDLTQALSNLHPILLVAIEGHSGGPTMNTLYSRNKPSWTPLW